VFEPRYLNMVDDALGAERLIGMIQPATGDENNPKPELADVGTVGRITAFQETDDGRYLITLTGVARFDMVREIETDTPYRQALVDYEPFEVDFKSAMGHTIDRAGLIVKLKKYANLHGFNVDWDSVEQAPTETIINVAAQICPFDSAAKQALLESVTLDERNQTLIALLDWDAAADQGRPGSIQ
jgi:Lon protease-like protein